MLDIIHIFSPLIYSFFVKTIKFIKPCPESRLMVTYRSIHNINLAIISLYMFIGIIIANYETGKFNSLESLICKSYEGNFVLGKYFYIQNI